MKQVPRERIALIVFCACILLMLAGIVAYLFAGHSWNHAATRIDDAAGEMSGYHVVLFEGCDIPAKSHVDKHGVREKQVRSMESSRLDYREKDAEVFALDTSNLEAYADPVLLERGDYRIGVAYVAENDTTKAVNDKTAYLHDHGANAVIAISEGALDEEKSEAIDVIIDLHAQGSRDASEADRKATVMDMPAVGQIGAIVISPSEVVSTRIR